MAGRSSAGWGRSASTTATGGVARSRTSHKVIASLGMPILRTIHGTGLIEGGSFCFLKPGVAALGMSFRQNEEGARQIEEVLHASGARLVRIPLTGHSLHLDGCVLMVDRDKALI